MAASLNVTHDEMHHIETQHQINNIAQNAMNQQLEALIHSSKASKVMPRPLLQQILEAGLDLGTNEKEIESAIILSLNNNDIVYVNILRAFKFNNLEENIQAIEAIKDNRLDIASHHLRESLNVGSNMSSLLANEQDIDYRISLVIDKINKIIKNINK